MGHDGNPKDVAGRNRPPMHLIPPSAMIEESRAAALGADKYGAYNWREQPVKASVYYSAAMRHLLAWWSGEDFDPESGASPLAHVRNCMAILLDAEEMGCLLDDRAAMGEGDIRAILDATANGIRHRRAKDAVRGPGGTEPGPRWFSWRRAGKGGEKDG